MKMEIFQSKVSEIIDYMFDLYFCQSFANVPLACRFGYNTQNALAFQNFQYIFFSWIALFVIFSVAAHD